MTEEGSYPPDHLQALKQDRRANAGREGTTVLTIVPGGSDAEDAGLAGGSSSLIDQLVREGARRMLAEALQAEVDAYIAQFADQRDEAGRRLVTRMPASRHCAMASRAYPARPVGNFAD